MCEYVVNKYMLALSLILSPIAVKIVLNLFF